MRTKGPVPDPQRQLQGLQARAQAVNARSRGYGRGTHTTLKEPSRPLIHVSAFRKFLLHRAYLGSRKTTTDEEGSGDGYCLPPFYCCLCHRALCRPCLLRWSSAASSVSPITRTRALPRPLVALAIAGNISIEEILESCKAFATQGGKHKYFAVRRISNGISITILTAFSRCRNPALNAALTPI